MAKKRLELEKARADPRHAKLINLIEQCVDERFEKLVADRQKTRKSRNSEQEVEEVEGEESEEEVGSTDDDGYWII